MNLHFIERMCHFAQAAEELNSIEELETLMTSHFREIGVKMYSYRHIPPIGAIDYKVNRIISFYGFPPAWTKFYEGRKHCRDDPMINIVMNKNRSFTWAELIQRCEKTLEVESYLKQVEQLDVGFGLMLPVYGAHSRSGVFTLGFEPHVTGLSDTEIKIFQCSCQVVHNCYNDIVLTTADLAMDLTRREHEVIKLVSFGKSNCDIAEILGLSKHTIDSYLRRIYLKLGVGERVSASLRAMSLGLV